MQFSDVAWFSVCTDLLIDKCALEDGFKDSCCENFVIFAERYSRQTLLLRNLQYVESRLF